MVAQHQKVENRRVVDLKPKEAVRPHLKASIEDLNWVRTQPPCVQQLWLDCVAVEQFGGQKRELKTSLGRNAFSRARAALTDRGLFKFERIHALTEKHRDRIVGWMVENLHGYYNKKYWETVASEKDDVALKECELAPKECNVALKECELAPKECNVALKECKETAETLTEQGVDFSQPRPNHVSTTPQPPTKVVGGGWIETEASQEPPLKGASLDMPEGRSPAATQPPPPPQDERLAQPPLCQGLASLGLRQTLDIESPAALSRGRHEGEGGAFQTTLTVADTCTSAHTPASLENQARVTGGEWGDLGRDSFSAAAPPNFHFQVGDKVVLDWPESPHHQRVGLVQKFDFGAGEVEVLLDGMNFALTFPGAKLALVLEASIVSVAIAPDAAALMEQIYQLALANNCRLEEAEKAEMDTFTPKQLEIVLGDFQRQLTQHSYSGSHNMRQRFQFSLRLGRYWQRE